MMLERQNKELKAKLEELENSNRAKAKAAIGNNKFYFQILGRGKWTKELKACEYPLFLHGNIYRKG